MRDVTVGGGTTTVIPTMGRTAIAEVRRLEAAVLLEPQTPIVTEHVLHAGLYARTIAVPAGVVITGALVKIATLLIVQGDVDVYLGDEVRSLSGYNVVPASAGRKQAFAAIGNVDMTMIFPTDAETVDEAERQFTDELELLASRRDGDNVTLITGEKR